MFLEDSPNPTQPARTPREPRPEVVLPEEIVVVPVPTVTLSQETLATLSKELETCVLPAGISIGRQLVV